MSESLSIASGGVCIVVIGNGEAASPLATPGRPSADDALEEICSEASDFSSSAMVMGWETAFGRQTVSARIGAIRLIT